jgi:hypothetical protein
MCCLRCSVGGSWWQVGGSWWQAAAANASPFTAASAVAAAAAAAGRARDFGAATAAITPAAAGAYGQHGIAMCCLRCSVGGKLVAVGGKKMRSLKMSLVLQTGVLAGSQSLTTLLQNIHRHVCYMWLHLAIAYKFDSKSS